MYTRKYETTPAMKIMARVTEDTAKRIGHRLDLHLADYRKFGKRSAEIMIGYAGTQPTRNDISAFVNREFLNRVRGDIKTAMVHPDHHVVTMLVEKCGTSRPYSDRNSKEMVQIVAGSMWKDVRTADVWRAEEDEEGKKILVRQKDDDIGEILADRRQAATGAGVMTTFASLERTAGRSTLEEGDVVDFFNAGKYNRGTFKANTVCDGRDCAIVDYNGKEFVVPLGEIRVVSQESSNVREKMLEYYTATYGEDYALKMVQGYPDGDARSASFIGADTQRHYRILFRPYTATGKPARMKDWYKTKYQRPARAESDIRKNNFMEAEIVEFIGDSPVEDKPEYHPPFAMRVQ